ncbi:DNA helicase, putative [Talaromyces stipitatus ATCC 10500]|uniref:DNA 3'-5' helicase n=1 Tax=Talaromyces stipitatus (strain ATCC 10500 / CBS 375.48 / QM 6759 / NRRL 1006) TaxID=441959 RepID=B8M8Y6_TALSN|nr:DNA helicase, putative [Talaromyces stipitatus ATCC 10500]EED17281.1 DNA helicase, putative [Talaromyces stipitatus ATCC 10500]
MDKYELALEALHSLKPGEKRNVALIARTYGVDPSNLRKRFRKVTGPKEAQYNNQRLLNEGQSQALIRWINHLTEKGLPPTNSMLANFARDICGRKPGKNWASRWLKSHSDQVISHYSTGLDMDRKNADKAWKYALYFELLGRKIKQYNLAPEQIYNMDEKGFMLGIMTKEKRIFSRRKYEKGGHKHDIPRLSRYNARLLNTFTRGEISQNPIQPLQNPQSRSRYIQTWQRLIYYWSRVMDDQLLPNPLFLPTEDQKSTWDDQEMDKQTLAFCLEIIQQSVSLRAFNSILVSFAALLFWIPDKKQWMTVSNYTSFLSQLIYNCQIWILALSILEQQHYPTQDLGDIIVRHRDRWLLNDTKGPVAELLENRLYAFQIAMSEVPPAQVRWDREGQVITFQDVSLSLLELSQLIREGISTAQTIFEQELCLSSPSWPATEIPQFNLNNLMDNWDATQAGASFLTDSRNHAYVVPYQDWLFRRVSQDTVLFSTFWELGADQTWRISQKMVEQYEATVQRFLEALLVPFFIGSGQQARRTEFLGIRWRNTLLHTRDLFLHDGQMLFILDYHKSRHRSNASRWPARFLLPEVGQLVTQFLILIMPFRQWLQHKVQTAHSRTSTPLCDYLWASTTKPWSEDHLTQTVIRTGEQILGKKIHIRAWRQITIGIAIKKFGTLASQFIEDSLDNEDDLTEDHSGSMAAVFHYQAAHTPHTGNQVYGGTVNFRAGLTDAGLQEFRQASETWHRLIKQPSQYSTPSSLKRQWPTLFTPQSSQPANVNTEWEWDESPSKRARSQATESTLVQQFHRCHEPRQGHRRWTMEQAQTILKRMYGPEAQYRTSNQQQALQYIIQGSSQVVAVLRTNEGKSLLYLLPCQLPGARTTVVVLPLLVLKQDMLLRCQNAGIEVTIWNQQDESRHLGSSPLILVSVEQAVHINFRTLLLRLQLANQLDRVVFDECHLTLTASSYRKRMALLPTLRDIQCQMVFLTGTLPPIMMAEFERTMLLSRARLIRSLTTRRDLSYRVISCPMNQDFFQFAIPWIQKERTQLDSKERAILYCQTQAITEEVATILECPFYHADSGTREEKAQTLETWRNGNPNWIVATSAFEMGIDHPRVRLVIHLGAPSSLIDFTQEAGRLGRDQQGGRSIILLPPSWSVSKSSRPGHAISSDVQAMHAVLDQPDCRVAAMSSFLDGVAVACSAPDPLCDRCHFHQENPESLSTDSTTTSSSDLEENVDLDLTIGSQMRIQQVQQESRQLQQYEDFLQALRGTCVICRILPSSSADTKKHSFINCWNPYRQDFLEAKKRAQQEGKQFQGWMQRYAGCFRCYNPQAVCSQQGQGTCLYPDLVMQACWAIYQIKAWTEGLLPGLGGEHVQSNEAAYMLWLGQKRTTFGVEGSNAAWVAYHVFQQLLEPAKGSV